MRRTEDRHRLHTSAGSKDLEEPEADIAYFLRLPAVEPPLPWDAHQMAPSFQAAIALGVLTDVSALSRPYGLLLPVFLHRELQEDIDARLPGELGGLRKQDRLQVVVAQVATLLSRSVDAVDREGTLSFAAALAARAELGFDLTLPLLTDTSRERPRHQGLLAEAGARTAHTFAPYALYASLETDPTACYGLVLALQFPFSPVRKPTPLPALANDA